jgi:precorrin-3B synthase
MTAHPLVAPPPGVSPSRSVSPVRKGWCPGAHRPMESGDGLLVRIRLRGGRAAPEVFATLAGLATRFGNGLVDITQRAALQVRGVSPSTHGPLLTALNKMGLLDADAGSEARRSVIVDPLGGLSGEKPDVLPLALALESALADAEGLDALPGKFGFAVGSGTASAIARVSADIRLFVSDDSSVFVAADGATAMQQVALQDAPGVAIALATRFLAHPAVKNRAVRRMRELADAGELTALLPGDASFSDGAVPDAALKPGLLETGEGAIGVAVGLPFGRISAMTLEALMARAARFGARDIRLTPWRSLLVPRVDARLISETGDLDIITRPDDPLADIDACPGSPACASATVETRGLSRALAERLRAGTGPAVSIHVSGCQKGCARRGSANVVLVGRDGHFDLIRNGTPAGTPDEAHLTHVQIVNHPLWRREPRL